MRPHYTPKLKKRTISPSLQPPPAYLLDQRLEPGQELRRVGIVQRWANTNREQPQLDQVEHPAAQRRVEVCQIAHRHVRHRVQRVGRGPSSRRLWANVSKKCSTPARDAAIIGRMNRSRPADRSATHGPRYSELNPQIPRRIQASRNRDCLFWSLASFRPCSVIGYFQKCGRALNGIACATISEDFAPFLAPLSSREIRATCRRFKSERRVCWRAPSRSGGCALDSSYCAALVGSSVFSRLAHFAGSIPDRDLAH